MCNAMDIGDLQDRRLSAEELGQRLQKQELDETFEKLNIHMERCEWAHTVEFEIEDPDDRTEMVVEAVVQCYDHLESQYRKIKVLLPSYPVINEMLFMMAMRDTTLAKIEIFDGLLYSKATIRATVPMSGVQDEYERLLSQPAMREAENI